MKRLLLIVAFLISFARAGEWWSDPIRGLEEAKKEHKPVMFYFHSEHCPYCLQMETFVFSDERVSKYMDRFVVISVDTYSQTGVVWAKHFNVFGTPTFVFYDPDRNSVLGIAFGSKTKEDFINLLLKVCEKSNIKKC